MKVATAKGIIELVDLPLACCALESSAVRWEPVLSDAAAVAAVLCISGTISAKSVAKVGEQYQALAQAHPGLPLKVVAVGACASSGGPYWDFEGVTPASAVLPVDLMIPGCPPNPAAIRAGIEQVLA